MDNMQHPTDLLRSLSACCIFFASWFWTRIACTRVTSVNTGVVPVTLGSFCGGRLILSHHSASFVMPTLIVSFLYFNLLFLLEDNLISLQVRWIRTNRPSLEVSDYN